MADFNSRGVVPGTLIQSMYFSENQEILKLTKLNIDDWPNSSLISKTLAFSFHFINKARLMALHGNITINASLILFCFFTS